MPAPRATSTSTRPPTPHPVRALSSFLREQQPWDAGLVVVLALPALWPFFAYGLLQSTDNTLHLMAVVALDQQLRAGVIYPRWDPTLALGYGYPLLNFYGPGTHYFVELLHLLGAGYEQALASGLALMVLVAGFGMWRLAADVFRADDGPGSRWAALVAATAYMYAPYLLTNVFIRGALLEVGAQALWPWILWSFRRLLKAEQPAAYVLPAALSLGALAITHSVILMFVIPILTGYLSLLWWRAGRDRGRLVSTATAVAAAVGLSAFFCLPLVGERPYLLDTIYQVAAREIHKHLWTWQNFLDDHLAFDYALTPPYQLGLAQVLLAVVGAGLAKRRDAEWLFFGTVAVIAALAGTRASLPLWLSSRILLTALFPWRLLTMISLPLALFTAGSLMPWRRQRPEAVVALILIGLVISLNRPRLAWMEPLPPDTQALGPVTIAQLEHITNELGLTTNFGRSSIFLPRWVDQSQGISPMPSADESVAPDGARLSLQAASAYGLRAAVSSSHPFSLRFGTFYFPGWRAVLDDGQQLTAYPSSRLGLLTVDLPAGEHTLRLAWQGTPLQQGATAISLLTLAALTVFLGLQPRRRGLALVPLAMLALGAVATLRPVPPLTAAQTPVAPAQADGLQLLGFRTRFVAPHTLYLYPYWFVRRTPLDLEIHWLLTDEQGALLTETRTRPFFDALLTNSWPAGSIIDDAYRLALPAGLPPGTYLLHFCFHPTGPPTSDCQPVLAGAVILPTAVAPEPEPTFTQPVNLSFDSQIALVGYRLTVNRRAAPATTTGRLVVHAGDVVEYWLYWRAPRLVPKDYHGFIHLVDFQYQSLAQYDQALGPFFFPPRLWDTLYLQPDAYRLPIPAATPSGLYWPLIGVYDFDNLARLPVRDAAGADLGTDLRLPPLKVLGASPGAPSHPLSVRFEDVARLMGYDLDLPPDGLHPGSTFTLTVYYRSQHATPVDYTQFVHLYSADLGLAAQHDAPTQGGLNPTSAWVPGEIVADPIALTIRQDARPGRYALRIGLYDPAADSARLPVQDQDGTAIPDNQVMLAELLVEE